MTLLVTGGAGFIGSHFVVDWLAGSDEPVVTLDALSYAGHRANLAAVEDDPRHRFVQGDILDAPLVSRLLAERRPRASPADPAFTEDTPYAPNSPYAASKAAADHLVRLARRVRSRRGPARRARTRRARAALQPGRRGRAVPHVGGPALRRRGVKVLPLGESGRLGRELRRALIPLGAIDAPGGAELDLARRPGLIVDAAAYTAVDRAEAEPGLAHALNALAPAALADAARALDVPLVHCSADQVFDGRAQRPYLEHDPACPLNAYGQGQWAGEQAVRSLGRHLILRTTWLHSPTGASFARLIFGLRIPSGQAGVTALLDAWGAPP